MELYRKYRPTTFKELIGNKETKESLQQKIENENLPHALLFTGGAGTGKTTIGRILANEIEAFDLDLREIDAADFRGIDTVREIRRKMNYGPTEAKSKNVVWLLDEVHLLGVGGDSAKNVAQSALLKGLEEAPEHCYFVLCTTDPQMLMKTIRSRCTNYEMEDLSEKYISILLTRIAKKEGVKLKKQVIKKIVETCEGSSRTALTILEKVIHLSPNKMISQIKRIEEVKANAFELAKLLFKGGSWSKAVELLKPLKNENIEGIRQLIYQYCITVTSKKANEQAHYLMWCFEEPMYTNGYLQLWYKCHAILNGYEL